MILVLKCFFNSSLKNWPGCSSLSARPRIPALLSPVPAPGSRTARADGQVIIILVMRERMSYLFLLCPYNVEWKNSIRICTVRIKLANANANYRSICIFCFTAPNSSYTRNWTWWTEMRRMISSRSCVSNPKRSPTQINLTIQQLVQPGVVIHLALHVVTDLPATERVK